MNRRLLLSLSAVTAFGLAGASHATGASAGASRTITCETVTHRDLASVYTDKNGTATNGTAALTDRGVRVQTPDDPAKVYTLHPLPVAVKMSTVKALSYETFKHDNVSVALPSLQLGFDYDGDGGWDSTLVYEPYLNGGDTGPGVWRAWDALDGGNVLWWSTTPLPGVTGGGIQASPQEWKDILAALPEAKIQYYSVNQGTYNTGADTRFDAVTFAAGTGCSKKVWKLPSASPTTSPSASAAVSAGAGPALPVTGTPVGTIVLTGTLLLAGGAVVWIVGNRRRALTR